MAAMLRRLLHTKKSPTHQQCVYTAQLTMRYFTQTSSSSNSVSSSSNNNANTKDKQVGGTVTANGTQTTNEPEQVADEEELQNHWKSMESRVINRKLRRKDDAKSLGRGKRLPSAWDHENV